jgi:SAM-dependent methyltransferase
VTATDFASDLASRGRQRVEASALGVQCTDADAEALPFADQSFSAVLSAFGVMFANDQERAASEMIRVCRRGGRVGLANWTPRGFIGQLCEIVARYAPAPTSAPAGASPFDWGTQPKLEELFSAYGGIEYSTKQIALRARTPMDWVDRLRASYLPVRKTFALLGAAEQKSLRCALLELVGSFNRVKDSTMLVDAEYLEIVVQRR